MMLPPRAEVVLMRVEPVALQYPAKVAQEVVEVVVLLFRLNVEISVPMISTVRSFDAIGLTVGRDVGRIVGHLSTKFRVHPQEKCRPQDF
jgi:hypothetical protein